MLEMIEKVIRDGGNLHIEPALYGGDIFVCIDFPCLCGLNNATELSDATIVYEGTELKDTIVDICSPGDIRAIAVEDFLTDYAVKDPALLVARAENLQTALNHLEERLAEWYHLTDAQQKTILLSYNIENYHDLKGNTLSPHHHHKKGFFMRQDAYSLFECVP